METPPVQPSPSTYNSSHAHPPRPTPATRHIGIMAARDDSRIREAMGIDSLLDLPTPASPCRPRSPLNIPPATNAYDYLGRFRRPRAPHHPRYNPYLLRDKIRLLRDHVKFTLPSAYEKRRLGRSRMHDIEDYCRMLLDQLAALAVLLPRYRTEAERDRFGLIAPDLHDCLVQTNISVMRLLSETHYRAYESRDQHGVKAAPILTLLLGDNLSRTVRHRRMQLDRYIRILNE